MIRTLSIAFCSVMLLRGQTAPSAAKADSIDPAMRTEIVHLLKSMHVLDVMQQQMSLMMPNIVKLLKANPQITSQFADEFGRRFPAALSGDHVTEVVVKAYASHFSIAEVKDLAAFYDSPSGKKLVQLQPSLMTEVSQNLQQYGQTLGMQVAQDIAKEHPEFLAKPAEAGGDSSKPPAAPPPEF